MSIAAQIQTIKHGLFTDGYPPAEMRQILDNGTQTVIHWGRVRPAIEAIGQMPWYELDSQWQFFLNEERYPIGRPMDLRPDEVGTFQNFVRILLNAMREPMRILMSVHPEETSLNDVSVVINSTDLETLERSIPHVRRTIELAAIDDAITVSSLQPGSLEIFLTAGNITMMALKLVILLAKAWKDPKLQDDVRRLMRLSDRAGTDADEKTVLDTVMEDAQETFWASAEEPLKSALLESNVNFPEAQNKINQAAREIYDNAEPASADWKLPPAVVSGLPGGITVALYDTPEAIGRVIKELAAPSHDEASDSR